MPETFEYKAFINCPYDKEYANFFQRIIYLCYKFKVEPKFSDGTAENNRMDKILNFINECNIGIHDISRTETNERRNPRFNMPFELGLDYMHKTVNTYKKLLILDKKERQYTETISDLACLDVSAHEDEIARLFILIRQFFVDLMELSNVNSPTALSYEYETDFLLWLNQNLTDNQYKSLSEITMSEFSHKVKFYFRQYPEKVVSE